MVRARVSRFRGYWVPPVKFVPLVGNQPVAFYLELQSAIDTYFAVSKYHEARPLESDVRATLDIVARKARELGELLRSADSITVQVVKQRWCLGGMEGDVVEAAARAIDNLQAAAAAARADLKGKVPKGRPPSSARSWLASDVLAAFTRYNIPAKATRTDPYEQCLCLIFDPKHPETEEETVHKLASTAIRRTRQGK